MTDLLNYTSISCISRPKCSLFFEVRLLFEIFKNRTLLKHFPSLRSECNSFDSSPFMLLYLLLCISFTWNLSMSDHGSWPHQMIPTVLYALKAAAWIALAGTITTESTIKKPWLSNMERKFWSVTVILIQKNLLVLSVWNSTVKILRQLG